MEVFLRLAMPAPIVLVHGILGFSHLQLAGLPIASYFRSIPEALRTAGFDVPEPPALNPTGSIEERANDLKRYLETHPGVSGKRVHLVAHSMGGLDSRFLISRLGLADRVLSLTTIGTPHRGSPVADAVDSGAVPDVIAHLALVGIDLRGLPDLKTASAAQFNQNVPDAPNVRYFSVAGSYDPFRVVGVPFGVLGASHDFVREKEGDNDGVVSVQSAKFGQFLDTWPGSHFRIINWGDNIFPTAEEANDSRYVVGYRGIAETVSQIG